MGREDDPYIVSNVMTAVTAEVEIRSRIFQTCARLQERMNPDPEHFGFNIVNQSVPMYARHFTGGTRYLEAECFAERPADLVTRGALHHHRRRRVDGRPIVALDPDCNIYGRGPDKGQTPVFTFSSKGLTRLRVAQRSRKPRGLIHSRQP